MMTTKTTKSVLFSGLTTREWKPERWMARMSEDNDREQTLWLEALELEANKQRPLHSDKQSFIRSLSSLTRGKVTYPEVFLKVYWMEV